MTVILMMVAMVGSRSAADDMRNALRYAPAPVDNPLKGLVPYAGDRRDRFPHSLEFDYLPLSALMVGPDQYDWRPLERLLDAVAGRGHQAIFRVYLEFPGKRGAIPEFLVQGGLKVHRYLNTNTQPFPPTEVETPDYQDRELRRVLQAFIRELGARYDGDPRLGFLTAGLLGTWGEWHTHPRNELFASKEVQAEVMDAYEAAFRVTPVLLRYPAGPDDRAKAANAGRPFGYHDDSFAWATLETGRRSDDWFFIPSLRRAGVHAVEKWKTRPIGGEIRPEAWGRVFDDEPGLESIQDFGRCVEQTHVTWLMDSGMFRDNVPESRRRRAEALVRKMGYEFHVPGTTIAVSEGDRLRVSVELENRGVAPFYYDWPAEFALLDADRSISKAFRAEGQLMGLLPGGQRAWNEEFDLVGVDPGAYRVLLRVVNPLPNGTPLRFANEEQDRDLNGWLTLGHVTVR